MNYHLTKAEAFSALRMCFYIVQHRRKDIAYCLHEFQSSPVITHILAFQKITEMKG